MRKSFGQWTARVLLCLGVGGVVGQGLFPMEASAATTSTAYAPTAITMLGQSQIQAAHAVREDPWSGQSTSWVPVYYLQEVLKSVGVQTTWNGNTLNVTSIPTVWNVNAKTPSWTGTPPTGQMQFSIGGDANGFVRSPKLVAKDPADGINTTYVPVFYANLFLQERLSMRVLWTGSSWILSPPPVISQTTYANTTAAGQQIQSILHENTYLAFSPGESQTVDLGLGITARADGAMSHDGLQWHEGNWTVEVLWYGGNQGGEQLAKQVVAYLHTHLLPAPKNAGDIIISSADFSSTTLKPKTIIAWQEGTVVHQLDTLESPLSALQTVVGSN